jgi:hypothetical protein
LNDKADQKYLVETLDLKEKEEPPVFGKVDTKFELANPFQEKLRDVKKKAYTE